MVRDVTEAVKWTLSHAHHLGGDPKNITLIGQSAGAQLALMCIIEAAEAGSRGDRARRLSSAGKSIRLPRTAPDAKLCHRSWGLGVGPRGCVEALGVVRRLV
eukprot:Tamp_29847.p1 GENE.Tamp_29847~~Tamp_29847.p1  ORF type:complete len:110 (-),score=16.21 Tamp_29847:426-731(-)